MNIQTGGERFTKMPLVKVVVLITCFFSSSVVYAQPTLNNNFNPPSGDIGTEVDIFGANLLNTSAVTINGTSATNQSNIPPIAGASTDAAGSFDGFFTDGYWTTDWWYGELCNVGGYGGLADCKPIADDGVSWGAFHTGDNGAPYTEVSASAAMAQGDNTYGFRQQGAAVAISWDRQEPEIWIRFYIRYEAGYSWVGGNPAWHKWLYIYTQEGNKNKRWVIPQPVGSGFRIIAGGYEENTSINDWQGVFGTTSDGLFHMVEVHFKMDTNGAATGSADGIAQLWIDGDEFISVTDFNFSRGDAFAKGGFHHFTMTSNRSEVDQGGYVDISDIAISIVQPSATHPISGDPWLGPVNGYNGG